MSYKNLLNYCYSIIGSKLQNSMYNLKYESKIKKLLQKNIEKNNNFNNCDKHKLLYRQATFSLLKNLFYSTWW